MAEVTTLKPRSKSKKPQFPEGFEPGGTVKLRSGGSPMTVTAQLHGEPLAVMCEWHDAGFIPQEKSYPVSCLRAASDEDIVHEDDLAVEVETEAEQ